MQISSFYKDYSMQLRTENILSTLYCAKSMQQYYYFINLSLLLLLIKAIIQIKIFPLVNNFLLFICSKSLFFSNIQKLNIHEDFMWAKICTQSKSNTILNQILNRWRCNLYKTNGIEKVIRNKLNQALRCEKQQIAIEWNIPFFAFISTFTLRVHKILINGNDLCEFEPSYSLPTLKTQWHIQVKINSNSITDYD